MSDPITPETPAAGPWADDIRAALGEEHAGAFDVFDSYMREKVQPRMTELESNPGRELWSDLEKDPDQALLDLVAARYGDEFVDSYRGLFAEPEPTPSPEAAATATPETPALSKEQQELLAWAEEKRAAEQKEAQNSEYATFKQELGQKHGLSEKDVSLLDPFIYASPTDPDAAVEAYKAWRAEAGVQPTPTPEPTPEPPAVLGSEAAAASTPPTAPQYTKFSQLDDALGDWMSTQRAAAEPPPVVG